LGGERKEVRVNIKSPLILAVSRKGRRKSIENMFRKSARFAGSG
jgi:hypothetical protein